MPVRELTVTLGLMALILLWAVGTCLWHRATVYKKYGVLRPTGRDRKWEHAIVFRDQSNRFCNGFECGALWERMQHVLEIRGIFHITNRLQILDMAKELNWTVHKDEIIDDTWFVLCMTDPNTDVTVIDPMGPIHGPDDILPFLPPQDKFDPPRDWEPGRDD